MSSEDVRPSADRFVVRAARLDDLALMVEVERAASWARRRGLGALTLTTYVEVPWNGPYYERLGFRYLTTEEETLGLRAIRDHERASGLDAWPRACMRLRIASRR